MRLIECYDWTARHLEHWGGKLRDVHGTFHSKEKLPVNSSVGLALPDTTVFGIVTAILISVQPFHDDYYYQWVSNGFCVFEQSDTEHSGKMCYAFVTN